LGRLLRFGLTGALTTSVAYLVFIGLLDRGLNYAIAATVSWAAGLVLGFTLNRRFTFGITGTERYRRDFGVYALGAVLQLLLGLTGYAILIGRMHLSGTPAFAVNLVVTTTFSFLFLRFVTFRRVAEA